MTTKMKAVVDRAYRADVVLENVEKLVARVVGVPRGGAFNADDTVELAYPMRTKNVTVKKTRKDAATGADVEYDTIEEREVEERTSPKGEPIEPVVARLVGRKYDRRTYAKYRSDPKKLVDELGKRGWPFEQLAEGALNVAHPKGTDLIDTAKVCGLNLEMLTKTKVGDLVVCELHEPEAD